MLPQSKITRFTKSENAFRVGFLLNSAHSFALALHDIYQKCIHFWFGDFVEWYRTVVLSIIIIHFAVHTMHNVLGKDKTASIANHLVFHNKFDSHYCVRCFVHSNFVCVGECMQTCACGYESKSEHQWAYLRLKKKKNIYNFQ